MKRMTKSKTMSVPKVVKAYGCLWRVMKHFEMSTKSKENLNEALAIHEMNQLKLLSWGVIRMAHFVTACKQFTKLLPDVYNCMCNTNIKKEERGALFTVENIFLLLLMSDLKLYSKISFSLKWTRMYQTAVDTADQIK